MRTLISFVLLVSEMDLWNQNQISHTNLLTSVTFLLLPMAVLNFTRFSDECMAIQYL